MKHLLASLVLGLSALLAFGTAQIAVGADNAPVGENAWLEVDRDLFEQNLKLVLDMVDGKCDVCAILKGDAYGHGLVNLMPSVKKLGIKTIGIASNDEARIVREFGFQGRLARVRTGTCDEIQAGLPYDMEELLGNLEQASQVDQIGAKAGRKIKFHLAFNSGGMNRNGIDMTTEQGRKDALAIAKLPHLQLVGIMTHYAFHGKAEIKRRLAAFNSEVDWLVKNAHLNRSKLTLHTAASYAALFVPESRLDMIRPGGILYGDMPEDPDTPFQSIVTFKTKVASVNSYPKGTPVGYDHTYVVSRDSRLANLPIGYSDGYRREFSNKGYVLIRGHRVAVVGNVCMNTTMVDVTDFPDIKANDEVVLCGKQGKDEITREEIIEINNATFHDMCTLWGNSNPKVLVSKGKKIVPQNAGMKPAEKSAK
ncbi:MAG: alanine racemase [Thermoguttaceae bacterium]|nr:alanine racemase [Thermoguttaceae bacterium]